MNKKFLNFLLALIGASIAFVLNYFVLENLLIPDPCYYHNRETNILFDIFYMTPSFNGRHPLPTIFNYIFTLLVGGILGWVLANYLTRKTKKAFDSLKCLRTT